MTRTVEIIGAGLSGMTAGICLAREGYQVTILDAQKEIGGSPAMHPSVHTTPAQLPELIEYIGIDISDNFVRCDPYPIFHYNKKVLKFPAYVAHNSAYSIERGPRPSSIDHFLYRLAKEAGVSFTFGERMEFSDLAPGTIVATGLAPDAYKKLGVAYRDLYGVWSHQETDDPSSTAFVYMGFFSQDYAYTARVNGLDYSLLFSHHDPTEKDMAAYKRVLRAVESKEYPEPWRRVKMCVSAEPKLFSDGLILAGTLGGMIEPFWGYGIVGALISGRLAATAVTDPDRAAREHAAFSRGFKKKLVRRDVFARYPAWKRGLLTRAGLAWARLQCTWNKELAGKQREPLKWFR
ncbi:MAG: NAD(P)-binding protein [Deltaproteobacteria bacterium]|nr:NAD(P)-binding protein [Candidatus Zymogenaceae bacterium]